MVLRVSLKTSTRTINFQNKEGANYAMPDSEGSSGEDTVPLTPESFAEDVLTEENEHVFGWLRPLNECAHRAFNIMVDRIIKSRGTSSHTRQFIHCSGKSPSIFRSDGSFEGGRSKGTDDLQRDQWTGAFKFSLDVLPKTPAEGWYIGSGLDKPGVDVLLAPPSRSWQVKGISGCHARIYIHKQSCRVVVEARHRMFVDTAGKAEIISQGTSRALETGQMIQIGQLSYTYEDGEAISNGTFKS